MSEIKLCKDCKHYTEYDGTFIKLCAVGKIEVVRGQLDETCGFARSPNGSCGIEAKNFEQKPKAVAAPAEEKAHIEFNLPHQKERVWWNFWR